MAHEIDESTGRPAIAFVGDTPWHGLGQQLKPKAPIEEWRKAAGMDWSIEEHIVQARRGGAKTPVVIDGYKALLRSDTQAPLSIVAKTYKTVQPAQVLNFFKDLVERGGFQLETAGCLRGGRRFWALAKTGVEVRVMGQDLLKGYLLCATSADRSLATIADFTSTRVVCQNTLSAAAEDRNMQRILHSSVFDPKHTQINLGLAQDTFGAFGDRATKLAKQKLSRDEAIRYFGGLLLKDKAEGFSMEELQVKSERVAQLLQAYDTGPGSDLKSANGTLWGAVNAATFYVDHMMKAKSQDNRLNSAWFGAGNRLKNRAMAQAMLMVA